MKKNKLKLKLLKIVWQTLAVYSKNPQKKSGCRTSLMQWTTGAIISLILSLFIAFDVNTVEYMRQIINLTNDIILAFFAIIVGAFALYQALLSGNVISVLYKSDDIFKNLNESWLGIILLYLFEAILNYVLSCVMVIIPNEYLVSNSYILSSFIALVLTWIYFTFTIRIFFEMKNFVVNLYNMFQIYNKVKILEEMKTKDDESEM